MSYHMYGPFANAKASAHATYYKVTGAPTNIYDGCYNRSGSIDESRVNASGKRNIHMLEMFVSKAIQGSTLSFDGSVTNLESHNFNGFVLVFVVENQLVDPSYPAIKWNFTFRDYGLNKTLILAGLSMDIFSGTWVIPSGVNATNIQLVAAAFDSDERDLVNGWPYAVQSVCDVCGHSVAIPEFPSMWVLLFIVTSVSLTIALPARKKAQKESR